jgi:hypothetical protein
MHGATVKKNADLNLVNLLFLTMFLVYPGLFEDTIGTNCLKKVTFYREISVSHSSDFPDYLPPGYRAKHFGDMYQFFAGMHVLNLQVSVFT